MIEVHSPAAPIEVVTPILPSEAIRLGCLIAPVQGFGHMARDNDACALGALMLGMGRKVGRGVPSAPFVGAANVLCPQGGLGSCGFYMRVRDRIEHLNDGHRWSRERIADWLEGLGL